MLNSAEPISKYTSLSPTSNYRYLPLLHFFFVPGLNVVPLIAPVRQRQFRSLWSPPNCRLLLFPKLNTAELLAFLTCSCRYRK